MKWGLVVVLACACGDNGQTPSDGATAATLAATDDSNQPVTMLDFGTAGIGQSVLGTVHVANTGTGPTAALALAISGAAANDFVIENAETTCAAAVLAPNEACTVVVSFKPTAPGARDATLEIAGGGATPLSIPLHGLVSDLSFSPSSLDFGTVETPMTMVRMISLVNNGASDAAIDSVTTSGNFHIAASACGTSLAVGASCDLVVRIIPAIGVNAGTLSVASGATTVGAPLAGDGARRITIVRDGGGSGTVTSVPAGITCGATCTGLFDTDVVLTAAPDASSAFSSWSLGSCGNATMCTVVADTQPITIHATFNSTGSSDLQITFAGTGPGEIAVSRNTGALTHCSSSCSIPLTPGDSVTVYENTTSTFTGITGACTSTATQGTCSFVAPSGSSAITATFDKDVKETWTRLFTDPIIAVAQDSSDNVIAATATTLYKLTSAGATVWSQNMAVSGALATGPSDAIYLVSGSNLVKLDGMGNQLWSVAAGVTCGSPSCIAVGADGSVALQGYSLWDTNGTPGTGVSVTNARPEITIDATGIIYSLSNVAAIPTVRRFQANGVEVTPAWNHNGGFFGQLAIDADGQLDVATSYSGEAYFERFTTSGTMDYSRHYQPSSAGASALVNGVAASNTSNILWWYMKYLEGQNGLGANTRGYVASVFTDTNTDVWSVTRFIPLYGGIPIIGEVGAYPVTGAYRSTQVVLGGHYVDLDTTTIGWLQAFTP